MTFLLKEIFKLIKLLNSETETNQIAMGLTLGFILGMSPLLSLQGLLVLLMILIFRIQAGAAFIAAFFFAFIAYLLDPVFHSIGKSILTMDSLKNIFTILYNMPIVPFTRFNNTIVMGSGVVSVVSTPFLFFIFVFIVKKYRVVVVEKFQNTKFWKAVMPLLFINGM